MATVDPCNCVGAWTGMHSPACPRGGGLHASLRGLEPTPPATPAEKMFPLQAGYRDAKSAPHPLQIPWSVAEKAYCAYAREYGTRQSLERLAERGGFDGAEMDMLYPAWREEVSELASLRAKLRSIAEAVGQDPDGHAVIDSLPSIVRGYRDGCEELRAKLAEAEKELAKAAGVSALREASAAFGGDCAGCESKDEALSRLANERTDLEAKLAEWEAAGRVLGEFAAAEMSFNQLRYRIDDDGRDHQTGEDRNAEHRTKGRRCYTAMVAVNSNPLASRLVAEAGGKHG